MPSKSRKRNKGQARKAKAKAASAATASSIINSDVEQLGFTDLSALANKCHHNGRLSDSTPDVVHRFITSFFSSFVAECSSGDHFDNTLAITAATLSLRNAYLNYPEAVRNENDRDSIRRIILATGVEKLVGSFFGNNRLSTVTVGCAVAVMLFDSYDPSSPITLGTFDDRDPKNYLNNIDVMNGCYRSLMKFFIKRVPCNCLDKIYAQLKQLATPKMGDCINCRKRIERSKQYICSGCERVMYCSKACQIAFVPEHKNECKMWKKGKCNAYTSRAEAERIGQTS